MMHLDEAGCQGGQVRQKEKPALVLLFFPLLEAGSGPFPPNLACTSVTNLPLSPKLKKKEKKKKALHTNCNTLFWKK